MWLAALGVLVGLCVGVVFGVQYHNVNAAIWGLVSGEYVLQSASALWSSEWSGLAGLAAE